MPEMQGIITNSKRTLYVNVPIRHTNHVAIIKMNTELIYPQPGDKYEKILDWKFKYDCTIDGNVIHTELGDFNMSNFAMHVTEDEAIDDYIKDITRKLEQLRSKYDKFTPKT